MESNKPDFIGIFGLVLGFLVLFALLYGFIFFSISLGLGYAYYSIKNDLSLKERFKFLFPYVGTAFLSGFLAIFFFHLMNIQAQGWTLVGSSVHLSLKQWGVWFSWLAGSLLISPLIGGMISNSKVGINRFKASKIELIGSIFFKVLNYNKLLWGLPLILANRLMHRKVEYEEEGERPIQLGYQDHAFLTESNLNYHTQIIGGSGVGKTNLLKVIIEDRVYRGHGVIFFDFKADIELMDWITGLSSAANRRDDLAVVSMSDPSISHRYNPFEYGSETEISSQIMNSFEWSDPFYKNVAENALMVIVKAFCFRRDQRGKQFFVNDLYGFLTNADFRTEVLTEILGNGYPERLRPDLRRICEELGSKSKVNYQGLINQFSKIINSSAGDILDNSSSDKFTFQDSISSQGISYLFMNSLKLKETAAVVGKMMLLDLMKTVGGIYDDREYIKRPITLIIDEFASFATPDFGEFIEKARGAGIGVIVAYQSRKSLDSIPGDLSLKINENTANKIVFQTQDSEDVQWFCEILGTQTTLKETYQAEDGLFGSTETGMTSVREVEEFVIHPNRLKSLRVGQALLISSKIDPHFGIIDILKANEYEERYSKIQYSKSLPDMNTARIQESSLCVDDII